jgi:hypothetical protein
LLGASSGAGVSEGKSTGLVTTFWLFQFSKEMDMVRDTEDAVLRVIMLPRNAVTAAARKNSWVMNLENILGLVYERKNGKVFFRDCIVVELEVVLRRSRVFNCVVSDKEI